MAVTFDLQQYRQQLGRRRAQSSGAEHEALVDAGLNWLRDDKVLEWHPTGPKVKFLKKGKMITTGPGPADRLIGMNGTGIWMEVKAWGNKNQCTYRERLHQFEVMVAFQWVGFIGSYLVRWDRTEWRLHPLGALSKIVDGIGEKGYGLLFNRKTGIYVPERWDGTPYLREPLEELCSVQA